MQPLALWSIADTVRIITDLPTTGPLPSRTILVPNESIAHTVRRELVRAGHPEALIGTRFLSPVTAASDTLRTARFSFRPGEESLRQARLLSLFREGRQHLRYFQPELLQTTLGWEHAFARAFRDLEAAGLRPSDLPTSIHPRFGDAATIWEALDESAKISLTGPRILSKAAELLERDASLWPFDGPTLAIVLGDFSPASARFLRAIPKLTLALSPARPLREAHLRRIARCFGDSAARVVRDACIQAPPANPKERDLLASYLFASPDELSAPDRPRSQGPDGTVHFEEHAGTDAEIEAAADWVAHWVSDGGLRLDEIAVLAPHVDPLGLLVADRIARLYGGEPATAVHIAGGKPLTATAGGARALSIVRALRRHLELPAFVEALRLLRIEHPTPSDGRARTRLSRNDAVDVASMLGTAGGHPAEPEAALAWLKGLTKLEKDLSASLPKEPETDEARAAEAPSLRAERRLLASIRAVLPAVTALTEVARLTISQAGFSDIARAYCHLLEDWIVLPLERPPVEELIAEALTKLSTDAACSSLRGDDVLRIVEETLLGLRISQSRYGEPAVYVGSIASAVGLRFRAVRILGLSEGSLPSIPREDPVLSDDERRQLGDRAPRLAEDAVLEQLHALDRVIREATDEIVLSFARTDANRTQREPSSIFLDAAAAIARPNALTGEPTSSVPSLRALGRDAFAAARQRLEDFRRTSPPSELAWLRRVASLSSDLPSAWTRGAALDLPRLRELIDMDLPSASDGIVGDALTMTLPGLSQERPISATSLRRLFECPYRFLLESVLRFDERNEAPSGREIDALTYGSLFHEVAETFSKTHGAAFGRRDESLGHWQRMGDPIADTAFDDLLTSYPLVGDALRSQQRERLRKGFRRFLEYDWQAGKPRRYVDAERSFGEGGTLAIDVGKHKLYVRGTIDRIDCDEGQTLIRDIKTGKCHSRDDEAPNPERDVQLALYGLVTKKLAKEWGLPSRVGAAYAHIDERTDPERSFLDDFELLEEKALGWLELAASLLDERIFPRTTRPDDCTFCSFRPVCGEGAAERSAHLLSDARGTLAAFRDLKEGNSQ